MSMKQILVCDDDEDITESIAIFLKKEGYKIFKCYNGKDALDCLSKNHIDLVLMDIMMPGLNGLSTVSKIRETNSVPIIFISAKSEIVDKVTGLNIGADDYITKPFHIDELKARVNSVLKRSSITDSVKTKKQYVIGNLELDNDAKMIYMDGEALKFTPIEYKILSFFMKNPNKVLSSNDIYKEVWNESSAFNIENTVAVHIRHIREKIEKDSKSPKYIKVVWGVGYKMEDKV